jgi:hypothetical protein
MSRPRFFCSCRYSLITLGQQVSRIAILSSFNWSEIHRARHQGKQHAPTVNVLCLKRGLSVFSELIGLDIGIGLCAECYLSTKSWELQGAYRLTPDERWSSGPYSRQSPADSGTAFISNVTPATRRATAG